MLTNHATVTWQKRRLQRRTPSTSGDAPFQFGTGSAGNPSITHDSITVSTPSTAAPRRCSAPRTSTTTYTVHKDILVPSGVSGCINVDNTATFTPQNPNNTPEQLVVRHHARLRDRA